MEAVWRIEVEDFPAFIVVDDKGNDFFQDTTGPRDADREQAADAVVEAVRTGHGCGLPRLSASRGSFVSSGLSSSARGVVGDSATRPLDQCFTRSLALTAAALRRRDRVSRLVRDALHAERSADRRPELRHQSRGNLPVVSTTSVRRCLPTGWPVAPSVWGRLLAWGPPSRGMSCTGGAVLRAGEAGEQDVGRGVGGRRRQAGGHRVHRDGGEESHGWRRGLRWARRSAGASGPRRRRRPCRRRRRAAAGWW